MRRNWHQLPKAYGEDAFGKVVDAVYMHVTEAYYGEGKSKYLAEKGLADVERREQAVIERSEKADGRAMSSSECRESAPFLR
ncbi:MAG TPA: hypothetical protein PK156_11225 [Polyangium sp.]|nr:hypothetical protein [Polyangium sp.]